MAKGSLIIGGIVVVGCVLGGLAFGADALLDWYAQQKVEQKLSSATGLEVDCAKADVNVFQKQVNLMDIRLPNLNSFSSPSLVKIGRINAQMEELNDKPLKIEKMVIQDVEINLDIQTSANPQQPQYLMRINAQELLQQIKQSEKTVNSSSPNAIAANPSPEEPELQIQQMQFNNIQVQVHLKLPLKPNPITHSFQLDQITLNDVTDENMPDKMSAALQDTILVEVQKWMSQQQGASQLMETFKPLLKLPSLPLPKN